MRRETKRKVEEIAEDWCFFCKDGGQLMICEYRGCLKAYHPQCVGKDDSFLETSVRWHCDWHRCFICHKTSKFQCFFCPRAVCGCCVNDTDFPIVKGNKGYCHHCLKLALLIEDVDHVDSDEALVDFEDRDTYEYLFMEYYNFVKGKEGLDTHHINMAKNLRKKGKSYKCGSDSCESGQEKPGESGWNSDLVDSDYDDINDTPYYKHKKKRKVGTRKLKSMNVKVKGLVDSDYNDIIDTSYYKPERSEKHFTKKAKLMNAKVKHKKMEFDGWGSAILIKFLHHVGKVTSEELSQDDVTSTIIKYCQENNLFDPDKKKKVVCDSWLYSLFRRKSVNKNSIYNLLSIHFAENMEQIKDGFGFSSEETNMEVKEIVSCKTQRREGMYGKPKEEPELKVYESHLAAIISQNIKHVYLKKSLMEELLKDVENINEKVIGSFVRVKSDPNDYLQKNSHLLLPVTGVTISCHGKTDEEFILQFSNPPRSEPVCKISDADFSEEECEDLRHRMKNGPLKQPSRVELEQKAKSLHMDITKHRITSELALLQRLIDRANEKGWRRELSEYLDRKMLLETPKEQERLYAEVPKVIADKIEQSAVPNNCLTKDEQKEKLPLATALEDPCENLKDYSQGSNTCYRYYGKGATANEAPLLEDKDNVPLFEVPNFSFQSSTAKKTTKLSNLPSPSGNDMDSPPRDEHRCFEESKQQHSKLLNLPSPNSPSRKQTKLSNVSPPDVVDIDSSPGEEHSCSPKQKQNDSKTLARPACTVKVPSNFVGAKPLQSELDMKGRSFCPTIDVEEIIKKGKGNESVTAGKVADIETPIWYAIGPNGERRGPVSTSLLKRWGEAIPYASQFKVWKTIQSENDAIFLLDAVSQNYPNL